MYTRSRPMLPPPRKKKRGLFGFGDDFNDSTQCSEIPLGYSYRRPGNYCATPDGGMTTFNADGSTYRTPGASVDPDPAHPAGMSSSGGGSIWDAIAGALSPHPPTTTVIAPRPGMSTTTMIAIGGGIVLLAVVLSRR